MKTKLIDAEYAPYTAHPDRCINGAWVVRGVLSSKYTQLAFSGTKRECLVVAEALNNLAQERGVSNANATRT